MKTKLLFTLILSVCMGAMFAQDGSTGAQYGAKSPDHPESKTSTLPNVAKPLPNPATNGVMDIGEGFDNVSTLTAGGWYAANASNPLGSTDWFQGNPNVFPAYDGAPSAYIGANFNNTTSVGTISNWLLTPEQNLQNGNVLTFYTRTVTGNIYPERLQVRLSINGASTNVGVTETSVGDFNILLLDIDPAYVIGGYPEVWTQYAVTVSGLSGPESGRFAFRYFVENGGPLGDNSNYIGIDRVEFTEPVAAPISNWAIAIGIGLILTFMVIRIRRFV